MEPNGNEQVLNRFEFILKNQKNLDKSNSNFVDSIKTLEGMLYERRRIREIYDKLVSKQRNASIMEELGKLTIPSHKPLTLEQRAIEISKYTDSRPTEKTRSAFQISLMLLEPKSKRDSKWFDELRQRIKYFESFAGGKRTKKSRKTNRGRRNRSRKH